MWTIGCILCAHLAGFFGISYFDQIKQWWFVTLAMIPAASDGRVRCRINESSAEMEYTVPEIVGVYRDPDQCADCAVNKNFAA